MNNDNPDIVKIPLSKQGKHKGKYEAIVSIEDVDLSEFNWSVLPNKKIRYAARATSRTEGKQKILLLHRVIMERMLGYPIPDGMQVDHIDGNGLRNTRDNLRLATNPENGRNRRKNTNSTSGYKGVYWQEKAKKWHARIMVGGEHKYLGLFDTPEEAYAAYCEAAKKYHGEFANFE